MDLPEHLLEPIRRVATTFPEVRAVYVFGSQAVGGARPDSDLDLGVLYRTGQAFATTLGLEQDFEQVIGRKIDLIDLGRASAGALGVSGPLSPAGAAGGSSPGR